MKSRDDNCRALGRVEEVQGLYGPFTFSEHLLQQIWARRDYDGAQLMTHDGRRVTVLNPGRWNSLGGPDFKEARIRFDTGPVQTGDVELHLHAVDWNVHGHAADPAYDRVILHVVLFPEAGVRAAVGFSGQPLPTLALLPYLHHSLEEYATEAAVEGLAGRPLPEIQERLRGQTPEALANLIETMARERWRQKLRYASLRLERLGWVDACHQAALEVLGYRFNRAPMLDLAARYPFARWQARDVDLSQAYAAVGDRWTLHGVRPANHPWQRLQQYAAWVARRPDWPERWAAMATAWPVIAWTLPTGAARRGHGLAAQRTAVADQLCARCVGGNRLDNLICDGWLPLAAARTGQDLSGLWWHWWPGDQPDFLGRILRELGVISGPAKPAAHGPLQGILQQFLALEGR